MWLCSSRWSGTRSASHTELKSCNGSCRSQRPPPAMSRVASLNNRAPGFSAENAFILYRSALLWLCDISPLQHTKPFSRSESNDSCDTKHEPEIRISSIATANVKIEVEELEIDFPRNAEGRSS